MTELEDLLNDLTSGEDARAEIACSSLKSWGDAALTALRELLDSSDLDHRWWAIRTLSTFESPIAGDLIHRSLFDSEASVRHCAALGLRESPSLLATPALVNVLGSEDRLFARLAGDALVTLGEHAIPALADAIQTSNPAVRGEIARALAKMKEPATLPILYAMSDDPSTIVQHWVEQGFESLGVGMVFFKP